MRLIKAHYASAKMRVRASGGASMSLDFRFRMLRRCNLFNLIIDCSGVQIWVNVHVLVPTMVLSNDYREMVSRFDAVNHYAEAKVLSALIRGGY